MITTLADLLPLMPLLITTATTIVAMIVIGIRRNYALTAGITIAGPVSYTHLTLPTKA